MVNKEMLNQSGLKDKTAYEAIQNVRKEERRKLREKLHALANENGFVVVAVVLWELCVNPVFHNFHNKINEVSYEKRQGI